MSSMRRSVGAAFGAVSAASVQVGLRHGCDQSLDGPAQPWQECGRDQKACEEHDATATIPLILVGPLVGGQLLPVGGGLTGLREGWLEEVG